MPAPDQKKRDSFRSLFAPLAGATRFFADSANAAAPKITALRFLFLLGLCAAVATGFDSLAQFLTADFRAAVARASPVPQNKPFLPSPYSQIVQTAAFVAIWLIYIALFAALRAGAARLLMRDAPAAPGSYAQHASYAMYAAVPLLLGAVLARGLALINLPVDPSNLRLPTNAAVWLPPALFVLALFAEAWIVSRALILRHAARAATALLVWAAPLIFWAGLFALYLFVFAIVHYPA